MMFEKTVLRDVFFTARISSRERVFPSQPGCVIEKTVLIVDWSVAG